LRGDAEHRDTRAVTVEQALCAGKPRPVAQSQMTQPPRVRRRCVERPGRNAASSWGSAARLLQRCRQADLRRPCGHRDACQGPRRFTAPPDPLARKTSPLNVPPPRSTRIESPLVLSRVHWVEPKLVAEITYLPGRPTVSCVTRFTSASARTRRRRTSGVKPRAFARAQRRGV